MRCDNMSKGWTSDMRIAKTHNCPCTQDCKGRSLNCRKTCQAFIEYEERRLSKQNNRGYNYWDGVTWDDALTAPMTIGRYNQKRKLDRLRQKRLWGRV